MGINLWLTYDCNLNCKYCYERDIKVGQSNIINNNTINNFLEFIKKFLVENNKNKYEPYIVNLHGGEPLVRYDLLKKVVNELKLSEELKDKEILFGVTTNGTLLNDEIIEFLCANFKYSLSISIDGIKAAHDKNRTFINGDGTFDIVINNALKVLSKRPDLRVRMTFDSSTVKELYNNVIYLMKLGFKTIVPAPDLFDKNWDDAAGKELEKQIKMIINSKDYKGSSDINIGIINEIKRNNPKIICTGGINSINIAPDGKLYPCTYVVGKEEFQIGNVLDGIDNEKLLVYRNIYNCKNDQCNGCTYYDYCSAGRCKFVNKLITGNYLIPAPKICMINNIKYSIWNENFRNT